MTEEPGDSPGKNTRVGCHALFQGIFSDPGIEPKSLRSPLLAGGLFITSATLGNHTTIYGASPVARQVKNLPEIQEMWAQFLGREHPL